MPFRKVGSIAGHDYVDLGLPSGKLWATCNVGADSPYSSGNYYLWKDTESVAMKWGGKWEVPSYGDWMELIAECEWTWNPRGMSYKITGPNGNSIILVVAGIKDKKGEISCKYGYGSYWSSSLCETYPFGPWSLDIYSEELAKEELDEDEYAIEMVTGVMNDVDFCPVRLVYPAN